MESYVHAKYTSKALRVMHIHRNRDVSLIFRSVRKQYKKQTKPAALLNFHVSSWCTKETD